MRIVTRQAAGLEPGGWTHDMRQRVASFFDNLAGEWHHRTSPARTAVVADVLERGGPFRGRALEVGSGIGTYTPLLEQTFGDGVVALELSWQMLARSPSPSSSTSALVQADAAHLPVGSRSVDAVVLINMFLFPTEVDRVLAPGGAVVWVNSSGDETPIHLAAADVEAMLPGDWDGVVSRAGVGLWAVFRRA
jgi:ubiquinone/menaquinone biosynthesis C-methylase UbiE